MTMTLHCRISKKAASLEAALASAEAQIGALQGRVRELTVQNASLGASLSAARAERNALNAAVRCAHLRSCHTLWQSTILPSAFQAWVS